MKNSQKRKKIIFGYRYDQQNDIMERLHEIKATQAQQSYNYLSIGVNGLVKPYLTLQQSLKNQNALLRAQIHRLQQHANIQAYLILKQQYTTISSKLNQIQQQNIELKKQNNHLKYQIQKYQTELTHLTKNQQNVHAIRSKLNKSQILSTDVITTSRNSDKNNQRKYQFSPYHKSPRNKSPKYDQGEKNQNYKNSNDTGVVIQKHGNRQSMDKSLNNDCQYQQQSNNFKNQKSSFTKSSYQQNLNFDFYPSKDYQQTLTLRTEKRQQEFYSYFPSSSQRAYQSNPLSPNSHSLKSFQTHQYIKSNIQQTPTQNQNKPKNQIQSLPLSSLYDVCKQSGINTEYMYNFMPTIQSQKTQQIQSQVQLFDGNFSFMAKPLIKNTSTLNYIPTMMVIKQNPNEKDHDHTNIVQNNSTPKTKAINKKVSFKQQQQSSANRFMYSSTQLYQNNSIKSKQQQQNIEMKINKNLQPLSSSLGLITLNGLKKLPERQKQRLS